MNTSPNRLRLDPQLRHDARIAALHGDPVLNGAGPPRSGRVEHTPVINAPKIPPMACTPKTSSGVVRAEHLLQAVHAHRHHQSDAGTDDECARYADVAAAGVIATSPQTAPEAAPTMLACP